MAQPRFHLPGQGDHRFLTDGGIETSLIYLEGLDLPHFAAFHLLKREAGRKALADYYRGYLRIAAQYRTGFILESPTWRASRDWTDKLGYGAEGVQEVNAAALRLLREVCAEFQNEVQPLLLSGCIGPRGDGYSADNKMTPKAAHAYHAEQVNTFREGGVDLVTAITMTYPEEAIGIVRAASVAGLPSVISFTVEVDGRLPDGTGLREAIEAVDTLNTEKPLYYGINCAHPDHFRDTLRAGQGEAWVDRIRALRSNASCKSHAELDASTSLDRGAPQAWADAHAELKKEFPQIVVFGGCCGTDGEHVAALANTLHA